MLTLSYQVYIVISLIDEASMRSGYDLADIHEFFSISSSSSGVGVVSGELGVR